MFDWFNKDGQNKTWQRITSQFIAYDWEDKDDLINTFTEFVNQYKVGEPISSQYYPNGTYHDSKIKKLMFEKFRYGIKDENDCIILYMDGLRNVEPEEQLYIDQRNAKNQQYRLAQYQQLKKEFESK